MASCLQCPACIAMLTVIAPVSLLSRYCKEAENSVMEFKAAVHKAEAKCRLISETTLLKVERKRMYEHREFAAQQAEHHTKVSCNSCDNKWGVAYLNEENNTAYRTSMLPA